MTKIFRSITVQIPDEIDGAYEVVSADAYDYDGSVALAKKGRDLMQQNAQFQQNQAKQSAANAAGYNSTVQQLLSELVGSTAPGSMSPAASAAYGSEMDRINNVYNGLRQTAFASMNRRGFGGAPSGFSASAQNALNMGEGQAQTDAYRAGIENTAAQRQNALSTAAGMTSLYNNAALGNSSASTNSAVALNHAGSTVGDILGGLSSALSGVTGIANFIKNWQQPSGMMSTPTNIVTSNLPLPNVSTGSSIGSY